MKIRSCKRIVSWGQTEVYDEVIVAFRNFADAPKDDGQHQISTDSHLAHLTDIFVNEQED